VHTKRCRPQFFFFLPHRDSLSSNGFGDDKEQITIIQLVQSRAVRHELEGAIRLGGSLWSWPVWHSKTCVIREGSPLPPCFERTLILFIYSHPYTWLRAWVNIKVGFETRPQVLPAFRDYWTSNKEFGNTEGRTWKGNAGWKNNLHHPLTL